ncbi:hypothetical protein M1105_05470 [Limibaculum sp. FT325]|nr:hypothetical protein [Limibaculum sediminis]
MEDEAPLAPQDNLQAIDLFGERGGDRTHDQLIKSHWDLDLSPFLFIPSNSIISLKAVIWLLVD